MRFAPPRGVWVPIPTFFKSDRYTIDFVTQVNHAKYLEDNGISGLVIMGSTGEAVHLVREERAKIISSLHEAVKIPIVGGVIANSVGDALEEIDSIKGAGASAALVLASNYFAGSLTQQGIIDWYTIIADKSSLPVLLYYYPGVSNNIYIDPSTFKTLSAHPNIIGAKLSHGDLSHLTIIASDPEIKANNFRTFTGLGQILLPSLLMGASGCVDALAGAFPKTLVKIFNLANEKNFDEAAKLQFVVSKAEEIVVKLGVVGIKRAIREAAGFGDINVGRAPLNQELAVGAWEHYQHYFEDLKALENSL